MLQNLQKNTCNRVSVAQACKRSKKRTLEQMFPYEFWETSLRNTFFTEHLQWLLLYFIFLKQFMSV